MGYGLRELADDLERLREAEIDGGTDEEALLRMAEAIHGRVDGMTVDVHSFHFVMHYLIDVDVRMKDSKYAEGQRSELLGVLSELRRA